MDSHVEYEKFSFLFFFLFFIFIILSGKDMVCVEKRLIKLIKDLHIFESGMILMMI